MEYFTSSADAMCQHSQLCKLAPANNDDDNQEEESNDDDNSREYDKEFTFN